MSDTTKILATVEIDPAWIPAGYEFVRLGMPKKGDEYLYWAEGEWRMVRAGCDFTSGVHYIIVRPVYKWPSHLLTDDVAAIAADESSQGLSWFAYAEPPTLSSINIGWCNGGECRRLTHANGLNHLHFTPPPCTCAADSLRLNPNWRGKK